MMGGDLGLRVTLPAVVATLSRHSDLNLVLVGDLEALRRDPLLPQDHPRVRLVGAEQAIGMDEKASKAARSRRRSSMAVALQLLRDGAVGGVVSAGNTGALLALGVTTLTRLPGIDRPAFCAPWPTLNGFSYVLDLGANVEASAQQLLQFAQMGSVLARVCDSIEHPRVAVLNVGTELGKGTERVQQAAELLAATLGPAYVGFVEGDGLFEGRANVVVTDGFSGNIALKSAEGTARFMRKRLGAFVKQHPWRRLGLLLARPLLQPLLSEFDPQRYNGAMLLGLDGVVVKSHGHSSAESFANAITYAVAAVRRKLPAAIAAELAHSAAASH
jgi:glycerol-3-phosphate acyltransferase PlsX